MSKRRYSRSQSSAARPSGERRIDQARVQAAQRRDAALARLGSTRRWAVAGAAGLSAGFAALVYALAPGHSLSSAQAATGRSSTAPATATTPHGAQPQMPAPAGPGALGLNGGSSGGGSGSGSSGSSSTGGSSAPAAPQSSPAPAPAPAPAAPPVTSGGS